MASVNKVIDTDAMKRMYLVEMKSIPDVAAFFNITKSTARSRLLSAGVELRSRADGVRASRHKLGNHARGKTRVFTDSWKANLKAAILDSDRVKNAAGTRVKDGYIEFTTGVHKGRGIHVVLMEQSIGRRLKKNEVVHHRDEDKGNNNFDNLQLMTRAEHAALHAILNLSNRTRNKNGQFE